MDPQADGSRGYNSPVHVLLSWYGYPDTNKLKFSTFWGLLRAGIPSDGLPRPCSGECCTAACQWAPGQVLEHVTHPTTGEGAFTLLFYLVVKYFFVDSKRLESTWDLSMICFLHKNMCLFCCLVCLQRQTIELIPVTRVTYSWKGKSHIYFVYGNEFKVNADDYPATCCCTVM